MLQISGNEMRLIVWMEGCLHQIRNISNIESESGASLVLEGQEDIGYFDESCEQLELDHDVTTTAAG
jgi:hypothetical protein